MMIGIQSTQGPFSDAWVEYCEKNRIPWKGINCYSTDIIQQLEDCDILMWNFYQSSSRDILFAKQLLFAVECAGKLVFPDFNTCWHFDNKVGQKYLLEAIGAPLVPSYVFYSQSVAMNWVEETAFPKVFKLAKGAGSANVRLVKTKQEAKRLIRKAFGSGFRQYNPAGGLKERWRKYKLGQTDINDLAEGLIRFIIRTDFEKVVGNEKGYIYFQDFIPDNKYDIRTYFVKDKCFANRRRVRPGDFRASGSGLGDLDMAAIPQKAIEISFDVAHKLKLQSAGFDFVMHNGEPMIVEVSYSFGYPHEQFLAGFWDDSLNYHPGSFNPFGWMVDQMIEASQIKHIK